MIEGFRRLDGNCARHVALSLGYLLEHFPLALFMIDALVAILAYMFVKHIENHPYTQGFV